MDIKYSAQAKAIKSVTRQQLNFFSEVAVLTQLSHPNIIRLFDIFEDEEQQHMVMEYCEGGDLASYVLA